MNKKKKKEIQHTIKSKLNNFGISILLGLIFLSFIFPSSLGLIADKQGINDTYQSTFFEIMQESQKASMTQQWSQGTAVSSCINPWDLWEFYGNYLIALNQKWILQPM